MSARVSSLLLVLPLLALGTSCSVVSKVPIPFIGNDEKPAPVADIATPFHFGQPLTYGHTLDLTVYAGIRSPDRIFSGSAVVDQEGLLSLGKYGQVKVGGLKANDAIKAITTHFIKARGESVINVHLSSIEGVPLLRVLGAVKNPGLVPYSEGLNISHALSLAGGYASSHGEAVYVTHAGVRHFHASLSNNPILRAGDIIDFSDDL